jgi:hypothetical protein
MRRAARNAVRMRFAGIKGVPRRMRDRMADELFDQALAEREQMLKDAQRKVQPATGGLIVPRSSLLVTPEEVRRAARR